MLVNLHSHNHALNNSQWVIQNLYKNFELVENTGSYSIGIHPWYIDTINLEKQFESLNNYAKSDFVVAIGECGLDKNLDTDFKIQENVFIKHIELANYLKKPIIVHCVKSYSEILFLLEKQNNKVPVIFHGFNKNSVLAEEIITKGYYLSFGKDVLKEKNIAVVKNVFGNKIFFETDNDTISIEKIYEVVAEKLLIRYEDVETQIKQNAIDIFGKGLF